jgi:hypothetical protein
MQKFKAYRDVIDIDYYVYFTKAYFAFNAYLKAKYPNEDDIGKIKKIKDEPSMRRIFERLIEEGKHFGDDIKSLEVSLINAQILNRREYILFSKVKIYEHEANVLFDEQYHRVSYNIRSVNGDKFTFMVGSFQSNPFKIEELEDVLITANLTGAQILKVRDTIKEYVSSYSADLTSDIAQLLRYTELSRTEQAILTERLYKGFMVIIYALRNALFHSEVEPNSDVMRVYKFAYFILRKVIKEIPTA